MKNILLLIFLFCCSAAFAQNVKEEKLDEGKYILYRTTINDHGTITIFEKKLWTWGGVFVFKNGEAYPVIEGQELPVDKWEREKNELIKKASEK